MTHPIMLLNPKRKARTVRSTKRKTPKRNAAGKFVKKRSAAPRRKITGKAKTIPRKKIQKRAAKAAVKGTTTMVKRVKRASQNSVRRLTTAKRIVRKTGSSAKSALGNLSFKTGFKNAVWLFAGMFAAQFGAKKFGGENTANLGQPETWTAMSYVKGGISGTVFAVVANMLRPGSGQKVIEGSIAHLLFQLAQNYGVNASEWAKGQFGEVNPGLPELQMGPGGDMELLGYGYGEAIPITDDYRMLGDEVVNRDQFGDLQASAGRLGQDDVLEKIAANMRYR